MKHVRVYFFLVIYMFFNEYCNKLGGKEVKERILKEFWFFFLKNEKYNQGIFKKVFCQYDSPP